jgi:hypothetical protein
MKVYWKREKLEEEYQQVCGKFLKEIELEKKFKIKSNERRTGLKHKRFQSQKILKKEILQKMEQEHIQRKNEFFNKKKASQGILKIAQDPKRFFKDVIGEKKSVFAKSLNSVKKYLKKEIKKKTNICDQELKLLEQDGSKREGIVINSMNENSMRK